MSHDVSSVEQLETLYGAPGERAIWKELTYLNEDYQAFVKASPFVVLASVGAHGTDCSPKGDGAGFVRILDERTLAMPDRPGNNRIDNLRNIVGDPRVSLLFLIPGVGETLRVNGRARISVDPDLLVQFEVNGKLPKTVIVVSIDAVYFHCAKSVVRSRLWDPASQIPRETLPSTGAMHKRLSGWHFDGETYDRDLQKNTLAGLY
ncbi:pyridoxamine 5'-phosphate oxidase [Pandoraea morbifera]|uniref:Pyridoxamine 5'-phosphate oxidase n=1 Tax=Pandoraea morbifera TaxID=2508300 RepID=A0A5E4U2D3_9BURK|nr:pyridoxamine 5'-phosphate oxidase family protein [Pandoraea morbifera]VVD94275.1 pyridoxamine 5'-phosphate oxidase [Pandoraea morbifera]